MEGITYMRMKFYVKGSLRSGTVQLDMKRVSLLTNLTTIQVVESVWL